MNNDCYLLNEARESYNSIGRVLLDTYIKMFGTTAGNVAKKTKIDSSATFKARFGDIDEFEDKVKKLVQQAFNTDKFKTEIIQANQNKSIGKYDSCKVTFTKNILYFEGDTKYVINKNYSIYIVNITAQVQSKQLTPQALNITGTFDKESLLKTVINSINNSKIEAIIQKLLIYLAKRICSGSVQDEIDLNDLLSGQHHNKNSFSINDLPKTSETEFSQEDFVNLDKNSINIIANDFGEILGGIFLLNYIKGATEVEYSNNISEPLIDYKLKIDDIIYGISAKAGNVYNGHKPASTIIFNKMADFINGGFIEDKNGNKITLDTVIENSDFKMFNGIDPKTLIQILASSNKESESRARKQAILLVDMFCDKKLLSEICKYFDIDVNPEHPFKIFNNISDKEFSEKFDTLVSENKRKLITVINKIARSTGRQTDKNIEKMTPTELKAMKPKQKIGMILYPLTYHAVSVINDNFGVSSKNLDFISSFLRLAFDNKQIYTVLEFNEKNKQFTIDFSCKSFDTANWKFTWAGSSNDPYKSVIAVQMI